MEAAVVFGGREGCGDIFFLAFNAKIKYSQQVSKILIADILTGLKWILSVVSHLVFSLLVTNDISCKTFFISKQKWNIIEDIQQFLIFFDPATLVHKHKHISMHTHIHTHGFSPPSYTSIPTHIHVK